MRYAISDIHGCVKTFKKALHEINFTSYDTLILIGDYVDRGPDSKGVVDFIIELQENGYNVIPLKGNHEEFLLKSVTDNYIFNSWMSNGGRNTLESYGFFKSPGYANDNASWPNYIPQKHFDWYSNLPNIYVTDDYVFVHGGLNFQADDPINETDEYIALRDRIYRLPGNQYRNVLGGRTLVTGHTPTDKETMIEMANGEDLITIDRGCVYQSSELGHLAVINLDNKQIRFIRNIDIENDKMRW